MCNIWSENRKVNFIINVLILLLSVNFLHLGQLLLPIMCLILFVDRKCKFYVNNKKTFFILCTFGISFYLFSYELGFYSTMGFCLPLTYYVGSNIKNPDYENIKKIVYLIAFGMALHLMLNFIYDLYINGFNFLQKYSHYDIWTHDKVLPTITAVNYVFPFGIIYYYLKNENKKAETIGFIIFVIIIVYNFGLGRRTPILILIISIIFSLIIDLLTNRNINISAIKILISIAIMFLVVVLILYFNIFNLRESLLSLRLIQKFVLVGYTERLNIFIEAIKLAPNYLWGGQKLSAAIGNYIHDLWMDTYDYAGIITFLLLVIYTIRSMTVVKKTITKIRNSKYYVLFFALYLCILIQCLLEPIMTSSTIFLICVVLVTSILEKRLNQ